ncbi:MAG: hypothetical protein M3446_03070 [Actinomycetota bacterium]|nr:hypothetical protein [Actinomycetota bacterium]
MSLDDGEGGWDVQLASVPSGHLGQAVRVRRPVELGERAEELLEGMAQ